MSNYLKFISEDLLLEKFLYIDIPDLKSFMLFIDIKKMISNKVFWIKYSIYNIKK
jgi:hypothetical protein